MEASRILGQEAGPFVITLHHMLERQKCALQCAQAFTIMLLVNPRAAPTRQAQQGGWRPQAADDKQLWECGLEHLADAHATTDLAWGADMLVDELPDWCRKICTDVDPCWCWACMLRIRLSLNPACKLELPSVTWHAPLQARTDMSCIQCHTHLG